MEKSSHVPSHLLVTLLILMSIHGRLANATTVGTADGSEQWGYVQVRPKAYMFWWLYRSPQQRASNASTPWPTLLWLQGGPGASGVGMGNFQEIGPLDTNLKHRNSTWLQLAHLLFVDSPVGTGYSYVEDDNLAVKTDADAATDLTALLKELSKEIKGFQNSPLFIVAESYGGKIAATTGLSVVRAIKAGELKLNFGGVTLGDSWISPEDFVLSWGPFLKDVSRLDGNAADKSNSLAEQIKQEIANGQYGDATNSWRKLEDLIGSNSNDVDFYNFLLDSEMDPLSLTTMQSSMEISLNKYSRYLSSKLSSGPSLDTLMNGVIKAKLKIIPKDVSWGGQSNLVFSTLSDDFMKPRINEVDELLSAGVNVTIYNGQLDVICATKGTEAWVQKLKWEGLKSFTTMDRTALHCYSNGDETRGFTKSYMNLHFYWILKAGHFVPVDQPCLALKMLVEITQSPAAVASASSFLK